MYRIEFIQHNAADSFSTSGNIEEGYSLLEAALHIGLSLPHQCGGMATCGTCYIRVQQGNNYLEFKSRRETHCMLKNNIAADDYRLACQCILLPGSGKLVVTIPGNKSE